MRPVNLPAQLAAAETELACLKIALTQVKEDREELWQGRDDWRREAAKRYAEKLIAAKIEADVRASLTRSAAPGGDAAREARSDHPCFGAKRRRTGRAMTSEPIACLTWI